jgi:hypothetical protein
LDGRERCREIEKGREIEARESKKKEERKKERKKERGHGMKDRRKKKWCKVSGRGLQRDVVYLC